MGITGSIAILTGFCVFLGHRLMATFFEKLVKATGIQGDFLPLIVVLSGVVLIMVLLVGIMVFILHKRFNLFKQLGKMYGLK